MTPQAEEAQRLMRLAHRDRGTFNLLLSLPQAELAALGFHAQQAAEKAMKAVAVQLGLAVPRTHDLAALGTTIQQSGRALPLSIDELRLLNPFVVEFRYDDEIVTTVTREHLASLLNCLLAWADDQIQPPVSSPD